MSKLKQNFETFDTTNPDVYVLFKHFTMQAIQRGLKRMAVALIIERIRWETAIVTQGDQFKVNNNHKAYYARKFMQEFPQYGEVFRTRKVYA